MHQNNKYVFLYDKKISSKFFSEGIKNYHQFCTVNDFKKLIKSLPCVTQSTSTLTDHILASFSSIVSQKSVIDIGMSDHRLYFCTQKISHVNTQKWFDSKFLEKRNASGLYSSCFMHGIVACMRLPFFKIFSNFVHFCPNFQIFWPFLPIFCLFSEKSHGCSYCLEQALAGNKLFKKFKKSRLNIDRGLYKKLNMIPQN